MSFILEFHMRRNVKIVFQSDIVMVELPFVTVVGMAYTMVQHVKSIEKALLERMLDNMGVKHD